MAGKLAAYVYVADDGGRVHGFGPGDEVPGWAAARITNPAAWVYEPRHAEVTRAADPQPVPVADEPPPQAGKGSSRDAWADYATACGVTVDAEQGRDEIIAACAAAGVPTE